MKLLYSIILSFLCFTALAQVKIASGGHIISDVGAPVAMTSDIKGTPKQVADLTARDAIATNLRTEGMEVFVVANTTYYQLVGGITNANWQARPTGGSANITPIYIVGNNIGVRNTSPIAPFQVGKSQYNGSANTRLLVADSIVDNINQNEHLISESSVINKIGVNGTAMAMYDARTKVIGLSNYNHFAVYQSGIEVNTSGVTDNVFNFYSSPRVQNGLVTTNYGGYIDNPVLTNSGAITNNYGLYIKNQTAGSNVNYGIYMDGTNSLFASQGRVVARYLLASDNTVAAGTRHIEAQNSGEVAVRINQLGQNWWEWVSPLNTTRLELRDVAGTYMSVLNGGKFGFKNTSPTQVIDVTGNVKQDTSIANIVRASKVFVTTTADAPTADFEVKTANGTAAKVRVHQNSQNFWDFESVASDTRLAIKSSNNERVTILANGNMGLGETNPVDKLYVNGSIKTNTSINVNTNSGTEAAITLAQSGFNTWKVRSTASQTYLEIGDANPVIRAENGGGVDLVGLGLLRVQRLTTTQRDARRGSGALTGDLFYNSTIGRMQYGGDGTANFATLPVTQFGSATFADIATGADGTAVSVTFATAFSTTPKITLTPNAKLYCWITTKSASGFTCNCNNSSGSTITAPVVDYIATN